MKKFSLFALAAAGMLLGACSSDNDEVGIGEGKTAVDDAFVGISIQLPSATNKATRANEDLDDGDTDEYEVKDATLYIFKGANEAAALYVGSYTMGTSFETDGGSTVTSTYSNATQIDNTLAADINTNKTNASVKYYAYVVVNNNGQIGPIDGSVTFADFSKRQFSAFGSPVAAEKNIGAGGLLMTNAPVSAAQGGSTAAPTTADNYTTLVEIDKTKVFSTADAAKAAPAACVYVERAAVKITVAEGTTLDKTALGGFALDGWQIINYEPTYYNTRQVDPAWGDLASDADPATFALWNGVISTNEYRFVSYRDFDPVKNTAHTGQPYRTFFAKDPHYNADVITGTTSALSKTVAGDTWIDAGKHGYTTENTFDVERQKWQNTTMATLRVKFNGGAGFYMVGGDDAKYTEANVKTKLAANLTSTPIVSNALVTACEALAGSTTDVYTATLTVSFTAPTVGTSGVPYTVSYAISSSTGTKTEADLTTAQKDAVETALTSGKAAYVLNFYAGGYAYYNIRIQHFGEYETPWSSTEPFQTVAPGSTVQQIYGVGEATDKSAARFLGRYGVVRDNWYKLSVDAITKIGSAEPVNVTGTGKDTPDDEIQNYISVHVHIVPWVIRNQSVNF